MDVITISATTLSLYKYLLHHITLKLVNTKKIAN